MIPYAKGQIQRENADGYKAFDNACKTVALGNDYLILVLRKVESMPKEEWGVKRVCPKCAVRFYDLQNDPMTCPSCDATFDLASLTQQKSRTIAPLKEPKVVKEEVEDADVVLEEADDALAEGDQTGDANLGDDVLDEDDDDNVSLEEIADVPVEDDEN